MERPVIKAEPRTVIGKQVGVLRRQGKLPGIIYGHNVSPTPITLDLRETSRQLASITASSLVDIELDGNRQAVLVREKQRDYIRGTLLHVDFQAVSLTEKIRAEVGIVFEGVSPAVKDLNGLIVTEMDSLEVEALPQDLPERFVVKVDRLAQIGDAIYVRDVLSDEKVEILNNPDEVIAVVTLSGKEEEVVEAEAAPVEEPEVIERGKREEEEEGEEA